MAPANTNKKSKKAVKKGSPAKSPALDRIVQEIASSVALGKEQPDRKTVMKFAQITNEKSFNTTILNIKKKKGYVDYNATSIWLTKKGREYVGEDALTVPKTNDAMQGKIRSQIIKGKKPREIFDILTDGRWYSRAELADMMSLENNKSFGTYTSALSKVVEREGGKIRLLDMAFPCGRPDEDA